MARRQRAPRFQRNRNPVTWLLRHAQMSLSSLGRLSRSPTSTAMTAAVIGIAMALPSGLHLMVDNVRELVAPRFEGRNVRFVSLAAGGAKQPHQLIALEYVLVQGGRLAEVPELPLAPRGVPRCVAALDDLALLVLREDLLPDDERLVEATLVVEGARLLPPRLRIGRRDRGGEGQEDDQEGGSLHSRAHPSIIRE